MPIARIARVDTGSIAAGAFYDLVHELDTDLTLKRIEVVEAGGASLNNVIATLYIEDKPIFRPDASLALFVPTRPEPLIFDIRVSKGSRIVMRITNNTAAAVRLFVHFVFE